MDLTIKSNKFDIINLLATYLTSCDPSRKTVTGDPDDISVLCGLRPGTAAAAVRLGLPGGLQPRELRQPRRRRPAGQPLPAPRGAGGPPHRLLRESY